MTNKNLTVKQLQLVLLLNRRKERTRAWIGKTLIKRKQLLSNRGSILNRVTRSFRILNSSSMILNFPKPLIPTMAMIKCKRRNLMEVREVREGLIVTLDTKTMRITTTQVKTPLFKSLTFRSLDLARLPITLITTLKVIKAIVAMDKTIRTARKRTRSVMVVELSKENHSKQQLLK
jgi:hypothetical protein